MDSDKNTNLDNSDTQDNLTQDKPADALSRTPDDLEEERSELAAANNADNPSELVKKKDSAVKRFFRRVNVYFLAFILISVVAGIITWVSYLNSQKPAPTVNIESQALTEDALKELSNSDATVGDTSQTLTIQGNAIIAGETLMRGALNVAGSLQTGGSIRGPSLTISGDSNLGSTQVNRLQVAQDLAVQGNTTLRDLSTSGSASFGGAITTPQLTVTRLVMGGNAELQVPNHISFTGPSPSRGATGSALGNGGSASINGTDTAGTVNIRTGTGTTTGCFVRINFNQRFNKPPRVLISPVGSGAGRTDYYADRDQNGFSVCAAAPAPGNQTFAYDYFVVN